MPLSTWATASSGSADAVCRRALYGFVTVWVEEAYHARRTCANSRLQGSGNTGFGCTVRAARDGFVAVDAKEVVVACCACAYSGWQGPGSTGFGRSVCAARDKLVAVGAKEPIVARRTGAIPADATVRTSSVLARHGRSTVHTEVTGFAGRAVAVSCDAAASESWAGSVGTRARYGFVTV